MGSIPAREDKVISQSMGRRIYYGWWILLLGSLINALGMGLLYHGFSVFFLPLKRDLAVSSAAISLLYAAARLEGGIAPIVPAPIVVPAPSLGQEWSKSTASHLNAVYQTAQSCAHPFEMIAKSAPLSIIWQLS